MKALNLGKLIIPAAITEFTGAPVRLIAFSRRLTLGRRTAYIATGTLSPAEERLFTRRAAKTSYCHISPNTAAARWGISAAMLGSEAAAPEVLVVLLSTQDPVDEIEFAQHLLATALEMGAAILLLRPEKAATLPSSARQRFKLSAVDNLFTTEFTLAANDAGRLSSPCTVAEFDRDYDFTEVKNTLSQTVQKATQHFSRVLRPILMTA